MKQNPCRIRQVELRDTGTEVLVTSVRKFTINLFLVAILISCTSTDVKINKKNPDIIKSPPRYCPLELNVQLLDLVNHVRLERGLAPLTPKMELSYLSNQRVREIGLSSTLSHKGWRNVLNRTGIKWQSAGENLAYGYRTPDAVVEAWLKSRSHRRIMTRDHFVFTGVGCFIDQDQDYWWAQHFGSLPE